MARRSYVRDAIGRFATVSGGRNRKGNGGVHPITTAVHKFGTKTDTRLATKAGQYGRGVGAKFVGGVIESSLQGAQAVALDALAGKTTLPKRDRKVTRPVGARAHTRFNRYGRARNRAVNRINSAKSSPAGRRAASGLRTLRSNAGRARQRVRSSRPARRIGALRSARLDRRIARTNQRARVRRPSPGARAMPQAVVRRQRRARARQIRHL